MRQVSLFRTAALAALLCLWQVPAHAQTSQSPQQIQGLIAAGQENAALGDLSHILQAHPDSGVAWYLTAEAQDALGHEDAARNALAKAEQYAPGLPFAQPDKVAALQTHLAGPVEHSRHGLSPAVMVIGGLVILFLLLRLFGRRRIMPGGYDSGYGGGPFPPRGGPFPPQGGPFPPGPGGMPYGPGGGGGIGSSIVTGLAAGAGFAAGERIIDDMMGGPRDGNMINPGGNDPGGNFGPGSTPNWDDGLSGSPGWDGGNSGSDDDDNNNFDPGNSW